MFYRRVNKFVDVKKVTLTSCLDKATNMTKSSRLLKVANWHHCAAHTLQLSLTVNSVNTVETLVTLLQKRRNVVTTLHFKSAMIDNKLANMQDKVIIENFKTLMVDTIKIFEIRRPVSCSW